MGGGALTTHKYRANLRGGTLGEIERVELAIDGISNRAYSLCQPRIVVDQRRRVLSGKFRPDVSRRAYSARKLKAHKEAKQS